VDIVFNADATASELFQIVLFFAVAWFIIFYILKATIRPLVHNKPWLLTALERDYERAGKKMLADLMITMDKEEFINWAMNDWPRMQAIYIQHLIGSFFCIPSILGIGDPKVASSLAICGVLSEMGWELQDAAEMLFVRAFYKNGKAIWPDAIVLIFLVHHSLTTVLGVPMVLYYRENKSLHWLCFNLQFAAAIALAVGEYTKLLDLSIPSSLRRFKALNFFAFVTMLWTRAFHWTYLCFDLYLTWYKDQAWIFLSIGVVLSSLFTLFSYACCIKPYYKKWIKFLNVSAEYESLAEDATPEMRRVSIVKLDDAVAELLAGDGISELVDIVEPIFVKRRPSRRQSVPVQTRKRRSLVMLQHSKSMGATAFKKDL